MPEGHGATAEHRGLRLLRRVRPHWRGLSCVVLSIALLSAAEVLAPFPLKVLVDNVLGDKPAPAVLSDALGFLPGPDGRQGLLLLVCAAPFSSSPSQPWRRWWPPSRRPGWGSA